MIGYRYMLVAALLVCFTNTPAVAVELQTVEQFLQQRDRWNKFVGLNFRIEGRVSTAAGNLMVMRKLGSIPFKWTKKFNIETKTVVQVEAVLERNAQKQLEFRVKSLKKLGSDVQRVERKEIEIAIRQWKPVYELADWALDRGRFYDDDELIAKARSLYGKGLRRELVAIKTRNYRVYRDMAIKAERYGLGATLKTELLYEGHYFEWQRHRKTGTAIQLSGIATAIAAELPGAAIRPEQVDEGLRKTWLKSPLGAYRDTTDRTERNLFHGFLYQQAALESIRKESLPDGRNGRDIAARIRTELPEYSTLATEYEDRERNWRLSSVTKLSQSEMQKLRAEFLGLNQNDKADDVLKTWFESQESELRRHGVDGLLELSALYEELHDDAATAVQLLLEAERVKPGSRLVRERLESYGYRFMNGAWKRPSEVEAILNSPINLAMREGRVIRGMTSEQVRKTLGAPSTVTRVLTARNVIELWGYGEQSGGSRLSVRMNRSPGRPVAIVAGIIELR